MNSSNNIYYTGIGAKKSGKHSIKEFLQIMKSNSKKQCKSYIASKKCKSCKKSKKTENKLFDDFDYEFMKPKEINKKSKKYKKYKKYKKLKKIHNKQTKKCEKCKNKRGKPCSLDEYLEYSGAERATKTKKN